MKQFIGRKVEIAQLTALIDLPRPSIAVIYGRRRVGKSELIRHVTQGKNVLSFEGLEGQPKHKQIKNFLFQLSAQSNIREKNISDWPDALILLRTLTQDGQWIIILDEFQWMANYQNELVSVIKMIWEKYLSQNPDLTLILCGSIASFMKSKVLKSSALYGRTDYELNLHELNLSEISEFFPGKGSDEVIDTAMLVGGIPKYLELISEYPSLYDALEPLAFSQDGFFKTEYDRLFASHFGKKPIFMKIIQTLATNPYGLTTGKLAKEMQVASGGTLCHQLDDLESAGFLHSIIPFDKPEGSKLRKYILMDAYVRFYHSIIRGSMKETTPPNTQFHAIMSSPRYAAWAGMAFEFLCMRHHKEISRILGFHGIPYTAGPFFQRKTLDTPGVQIDLLFERSDKILVLCEMKYLLASVPGDIIDQVNRKVSALQEKYPGRTILKVLLTKTGSTETVAKKGYFFRIIRADELITHGA
jgi:AAA+ ATPase superfamily predicted ATPase